MTSPVFEVPKGQNASRYHQGAGDREPYLHRARRYAGLTIPFLFREVGDNGSTEEAIPWNSLGAYCLFHLSSKVTFTIFPPGLPPMKLNPSKAVTMQWQQMGDDERAQVKQATETGLSVVEKEWVEAFDEDGDRATLTMGTMKQMCGGTHCYQFYPDGKVRGIPLDRFVCWRDGSGNLLEFVVHDPLTWQTIPQDIQAKIQAATHWQPTPKALQFPAPTMVDVYTRGYLKDGKWNITQECWGFEVDGSATNLLPELMPFLFAPWFLIEGEHYGRAYLELYEADLLTVEGNTQTVTEGSAAAARFITLVHPGGLTNRKSYAEAANGAVLSGRMEDIGVPLANKGVDYQSALAINDKAEQRLARAFLLFSAVQRNAERVTAEEIRAAVQELEEALGGVYAQQTVSLQVPYVRLKLHYLQKKNRVTALPKGTTKVTILGGLAALGRSAEAASLSELGQRMTSICGADWVSQLDTSKFTRAVARRVAAALRVDITDLVPTEEEAAQAQQTMQQQQLVQQLGPEGVKQIGNNLTANQVADTNQETKLVEGAMKQLPAPAPTGDQ